MEVDVSDYATGGVLSMECEDGLWRLVAFLSKSLNKTERNYKIHDTTKFSPFMANYERELRMGGDIRRKGKVEKAIEFVERMKQVQEEVGATLKKVQENMKR